MPCTKKEAKKKAQAEIDEAMKYIGQDASDDEGGASAQVDKPAAVAKPADAKKDGFGTESKDQAADVANMGRNN
jgi:hypothetical protein